MLESIGVVLRLLVEFFGVALRPLYEVLSTLAAPGSGVLAFAAAAAAFAALALLAVAVTLFTTPVHALATAPHPRRAILDDTRLTETHPDAPGHSRPRAPGLAALAA